MTEDAPVGVDLGQSAGAAMLTLAGTFDVSTAAPARGVVAAWNRALGEIMGEFLADLKGALASRP